MLQHRQQQVAPLEPSPEQIATMPSKRRTLYRPVHAQDNLINGHYHG
ncbi:MAG: hypothetical protein R3E79_42670 [Caldilineaceae bacterium]